MRYKYSLNKMGNNSDNVSLNIYKRRDRLYRYIKQFNKQTSNDGVYAENIARIVLDGVNLNHLSRNHPHVDIAIVNPIEGITLENEIISIKSSISNDISLSYLIAHTKSIKLESMLSYLVYANDNYELNDVRNKISPKYGLNLVTYEMINLPNKDYKSMVNILVYYLLFKNTKDNEVNLIDDINKIGNNIYDLKYGHYNLYRISVLRRITTINSPISLGCVYVINDVCYIHKTNPINLNRYWENLVNIWLDKDFFSSDSTKYLRLNHVKDLFNINQSEGFPIEIEIEIDGYIPSNELLNSVDDKIKLNNKIAKSKTDRLYVATKIRDADFGDYEDKVNDFLIKTIDKLESKPNLITSFTNYINTIK